MKQKYLGTDDVSLVEYVGKPVHIVEGDYCNIKVTTPNDIAVAKRYLELRIHVCALDLVMIFIN